jgi:Ycf66 protein N-terminus
VGNGLNTPALLFGIILLIASIGLFFWGRLKPELARDSDNVYSVIGIICSIILFTSAFDLSLILGFQQLLLIGAVISLMWENMRQRTPNPDVRPGGNNFPLGGKRDDDRASRRPYRAERANEYEEFGAPPRGGAGLEGRRSGNSGGYGADGYGADSYGDYGSSYSDKRLPRREGRDDDRYGSSSPERTADRSSRRPGFEEDLRGGRDEALREPEAPRSIPSRSSRGSREPDVGGEINDRPRRRPTEGREGGREGRSDGGNARPRRRSSRVEDVRGDNDEIPVADYEEYKPLEIREEKPPSGSANSWGPKD